jgi:hypothetical protein
MIYASSFPAKSDIVMGCRAEHLQTFLFPSFLHLQVINLIGRRFSQITTDDEIVKNTPSPLRGEGQGEGEG